MLDTSVQVAMSARPDEVAARKAITKAFCDFHGCPAPAAHDQAMIDALMGDVAKNRRFGSPRSTVKEWGQILTAASDALYAEG